MLDIPTFTTTHYPPSQLTYQDMKTKVVSNLRFQKYFSNKTLDQRTGCHGPLFSPNVNKRLVPATKLSGKLRKFNLLAIGIDIVRGDHRERKLRTRFRKYITLWDWVYLVMKMLITNKINSIFTYLTSVHAKCHVGRRNLFVRNIAFGVLLYYCIVYT